MQPKHLPSLKFLASPCMRIYEGWQINSKTGSRPIKSPGMLIECHINYLLTGYPVSTENTKPEVT